MGENYFHQWCLKRNSDSIGKTHQSRRLKQHQKTQCSWRIKWVFFFFSFEKLQVLLSNYEEQKRDFFPDIKPIIHARQNSLVAKSGLRPCSYIYPCYLMFVVPLYILSDKSFIINYLFIDVPLFFRLFL